MPFIGIISDETHENCIRRNLVDKLQAKESSVLFIKEKSIENIKNIKFETIVICREFKEKEELRKIIEKANYLVVNSDIENNLKLLKNINATVITYGFNSKATITASSVAEEEVLMCVQRTIETKDKKLIEPQEISIKLEENASFTMAIGSVLLIYNKII